MGVLTERLRYAYILPCVGQACHMPLHIRQASLLWDEFSRFGCGYLVCPRLPFRLIRCTTISWTSQHLRDRDSTLALTEQRFKSSSRRYSEPRTFLQLRIFQCSQQTKTQIAAANNVPTGIAEATRGGRYRGICGRRRRGWSSRVVNRQ
jgi:hypothetical protein